VSRLFPEFESRTIETAGAAIHLVLSQDLSNFFHNPMKSVLDFGAGLEFN